MDWFASIISSLNNILWSYILIGLLICVGTDGKVEKVGWLPLGGWRIGIRSPGGGFFYYAHLSSYAKKFQEGESVKAGEILGFLGDTGYGSEGTSGKFPCHLHLGIYVRTKDKEEDPLNPYPVLCFLKKRQKNFFF